MKSKWPAGILVFLLLIGLAGRASGVAVAAGPVPAGDRELRIERSLGCPQCTDVPLDVCDEDICKDMRAIIQQKIAAGESDQAIRQYFVDRYGPRVLLAPPKTPQNLVAWLMPLAGLVAGAAAVSAYFQSASRRPSASGGEPATVDTDRALDQYRSQAEHEIEQIE